MVAINGASEFMSRNHASGVLFVLIGVTLLSVIMLSDLLVSGRVFSIGWTQLLASVPAIATIGVGGLLIKGDRLRPGAAIRSFVLLVSGGTTGLCALALAGLALEKGRDFPYDATTGLDKAYRNVVKVAGLSNTGVCRCAPDRKVRIVLPGGFETQVSIYDKGGASPRPGLVVAHGNVWMGSDLSTYRLLASRLARTGLIVLTIDFPGFGKADDPFGRGPSSVADAYDSVAVLNTAIEYLIANTHVDRSNIVAFGHSGGVDWAMRVAVSNPDVSRVAVMVAPPPASFRGATEGTAKYDAERGAYFGRRFEEQYQFVYGRSVPQWNSWNLTPHDVRYEDDIWMSYVRSGHKPLLVILGERDQPSGHASVLADFGAVSAPKDLTLLRRSDHYLNTAQSLGLVFYDADVASQVTEELTAWINQGS